ncbi:unnamed protein product [Didymodactylos carnosus]|uniref:Uncharacterized protein n=1 Tax=Didymodactylos carnosus TaxID=1234261 RepID=A0A814VF01_9BILA|nr:unnamed protein product [Didymodactylos carnosus]CAF1186439.1 unnamed protein product [Didymodactylos carnosus]CAF3838776.1 unnamed protein product [Didymodactylos carnosus]CAF3950690.1 unnamed protein product [Didymodactylos carnosus]
MILNGPPRDISLEKTIEIQRVKQLFLQKYQNFITETHYKRAIQEFAYRTYDCGLVLAISLNFITKILVTFFYRIKLKRYDLYKNIKELSICLIPKSSSSLTDSGHPH